MIERYETKSGGRVNVGFVDEHHAIRFFDVEVIDTEGEVIAFFKNQSRGSVDALVRKHRWKLIQEVWA